MNPSNNIQDEMSSSGAKKDNPTGDIESRLNILEMMFQRMNNVKDRDIYNKILIEKLSMIVDISVAEIVLSGLLSLELKDRIIKLSELIKSKLIVLLSSVDQYNKKLEKIKKRDEKSKKNKKKWKKNKKKWKKKVNKKAKKKIKKGKKKANKKIKKKAKNETSGDEKEMSNSNNPSNASNPSNPSNPGNPSNPRKPIINNLEKEKEKIITPVLGSTATLIETPQEMI